MEELIKYGERFFDELEIVTYRAREIGLEVELNEISMGTTRMSTITIVRGIKDNRIGISIVDNDSKEDVKKAIEEAAKMARLNNPDDKWKSLPEPGKYREKPKVNEELKEASTETLASMVIKGIQLARESDPNVTVAGGSAGASWSEFSIANSHGVNVTQEYGHAHVFFEFVGKKEGVVTPGIFEFDIKDNLNLDVESIVNRGIERVKWAYKVKEAKNEEAPVIFSPWAISGLFHYALFPAFSGERLIKKTTPLADKVGEKIASDVITIYDDTFHELSVVKAIADGEGVPTRKTMLIENGVFKGFIWDNYWAKVYGTESTGHGQRDWRGGGVTIGLNSAVIENGKRSLEEMIQDIKHGYLVEGVQGAHSSNPDNGNFAISANPAYLIEDGEIAGSTVFLVASNIYELLKQASEVSKEQRAMPAMFTVVAPYIKFENVRIAGKR
ncbi:TldD/PmbA family protein [Pyrococcus horikoshii]|nr:TldD/PmbA family protein [Pyrococcus horikoshii]HII60542.1 TldD/PmbA family protein [Pyrococcus horikoshii]